MNEEYNNENDFEEANFDLVDENEGQINQMPLGVNQLMNSNGYSDMCVMAMPGNKMGYVIDDVYDLQQIDNIMSQQIHQE